MTRNPDLDLSALNMYNENGGVVQGQICGQAFVTKLLRKKGAKTGGGLNKELSLAFQKDANAICMSPVGRPKKMKFHKHNLYENMNNMNMSSIDTESCTSDDIFSDSSGPVVNAAIDDIETPAFVAQFDPALELVSQSNSPEQHLRHHHHQHQQLVQQNHARKGSIPWSASLPAVAEEDSQSEQSSHHLGIWRNNDNQSPEKENVAVLSIRSIMAHKGQIPRQKGDPNEAMDILESDRIGSPRVTPIALASPPSIPHSRPLEDRDNESQADSRDLDIASKPSNQKKQHIWERETKRAKEDYMREAVDRRIRQAMEDAMHNAQSEDEYDDHRLEIIDSELISADISMKIPTTTTHHHKVAFDPFHHQGSMNQMGVMAPRYNYPPREASENFLPKGYQRNQMAGNNEVSTAMQELLLQQQMTLKEMSTQNSHYRQELQECQEMFGKWRLEREKQRSTIQDLVKEKEAYATEASFLRNEMSSIRQELEALRNETRMQATVTMQSPLKQPHPPRHPQKPSPFHLEDKSHSPFQGFRHKQPHQESPSFNGSLPVLSKTNFHPDHQQSPPPESPSEDAGLPPSSALGLKFPVFPLSPPPPPPEPRTPNSSSKRNSIGNPDNHKMSSSAPHAQDLTQNGKPLMSGLKQRNSDSSKPQRSVKFQDPPMSKQWTLFPSHLHDDRLLEQSFHDSSKQSETRDEVESQSDYNNSSNSRGEQDIALNVHVTEAEKDDERSESVDAPTPIAANGRRLSSGSNSNAGSSSQQANPDAAETVAIPSAAYKYRLETMKQNRQQRTGRHSNGSPAPRSSPGLGSPERKRRGRSRPPGGAHR